MEITLYSHGTKNILLVPQEYEYLFDKYPLYKAVRIMNKDIEEKNRQLEKSEKKTQVWLTKQAT